MPFACCTTKPKKKTESQELPNTVNLVQQPEPQIQIIPDDSSHRQIQTKVIEVGDQFDDYLFVVNDEVNYDKGVQCQELLREIPISDNPLYTELLNLKPNQLQRLQEQEESEKQLLQRRIDKEPPPIIQTLAPPQSKRPSLLRSDTVVHSQMLTPKLEDLEEPVRAKRTISAYHLDNQYSPIVNHLEIDNIKIHPYKLEEPLIYAKELTKDQVFDKVFNLYLPLNVWKETRASNANRDGGLECKQPQLVRILRSVGQRFFKECGKKILQGYINLSDVPMPIKAMKPKSNLEQILQSTCLFPFYINKATGQNDPIQRLKLVIAAIVGSILPNISFLQTLQPMIGETIQASYPDGTQLYAEQISLEPLITYFYVVGPKDSYKYYGYCDYKVSAGFNKLVIKNYGKRYINFFDQTIEFNFPTEEYTGIMWGPIKNEQKGKLIFTDKGNNIQAELAFDSVRWKPSDYFFGDIKMNSISINKIYGSYLGFLEFDGQRYWDYSIVLPNQLFVEQPMLESDSQMRTDLYLLKQGELDLAQKEKDILEERQRQDIKLRKNYN